MQYINLSGYKFTKLTNLENIQFELLTTCQHLGLKGTILLSQEGLNAFVCASSDMIKPFTECITSHVGKIEFKESPSNDVPFNKMLVKIKPEIITFGVENIDPINKPAPVVSAETFKAWLDEGKDLVILDTRNDYEVRVGTFKNAIHLNIEHFRQFPKAVEQLPDEYKNKPVVSFCTGGIRCEKAAPFLVEQGFKEVYQLEGGILKYLEKNGHAHYDGECFVFDNRVAVDANLHQAEITTCQNCQLPVTQAEQQLPEFVVGQSCPHCYQP